MSDIMKHMQDIHEEQKHAIIEAYKKLNERCELILSKIKERNKNG